MTEGVTAYPLSWPSWQPRTPSGQRKPAAFRSQTSQPIRRHVTVSDARSRLSDQVERLGAGYVVLSTNLELRLDGQVRAGAADPADPGVALYFRLGGRAIVLACDRWDRVAGNMAAIAAHIEALRGQDRWGVGTLEQAFAGFAALPPPTNPDDWFTVLGKPSTLAAAEAEYRRKMKFAHPDAGGSEDRAARLNAAIAQARREMLR